MDSKHTALVEKARQAIYTSWPNDSTIEVSALAVVKLATREAALEAALRKWSVKDGWCLACGYADGRHSPGCEVASALEAKDVPGRASLGPTAARVPHG